MRLKKTIWVGCSLLDDRAWCAIQPVTVPVGVGPIGTEG